MQGLQGVANKKGWYFIMDVENKKATRLSYGEALVELGKENDYDT